MDSNKIGELIRKRRTELGLTQSELASKLNVTDKAVSKWEQGNGLPDISIIQDLARILNLNLDDLLNGKSTNNNVSVKYIEKYLDTKSKSKEILEKILKYTILFLTTFIIFSTVSTLVVMQKRSKYVYYEACASIVINKDVLKKANKNLEIIKAADNYIYTKEDKDIIVHNLEEMKKRAEDIEKNGTSKWCKGSTGMYQRYLQLGNMFNSFLPYPDGKNLNYDAAIVSIINKNYNKRDESGYRKVSLLFYQQYIRTLSSYGNYFLRQALLEYKYVNLNTENYGYDIYYDFQNNFNLNYSGHYLKLTEYVIEVGELNE